MNDFQSFLFQNMQLIGLPYCEDSKSCNKKEIENSIDIFESKHNKNTSINIYNKISKKIDNASTISSTSTNTTSTNTVSSSILVSKNNATINSNFNLLKTNSSQNINCNIGRTINDSINENYNINNIINYKNSLKKPFEENYSKENEKSPKKECIPIKSNFLNDSLSEIKIQASNLSNDTTKTTDSNQASISTTTETIFTTVDQSKSSLDNNDSNISKANKNDGQTNENILPPARYLSKFNKNLSDLNETKIKDLFSDKEDPDDYGINLNRSPKLNKHKKISLIENFYITNDTNNETINSFKYKLNDDDCEDIDDDNEISKSYISNNVSSFKIKKSHEPQIFYNKYENSNRNNLETSINDYNTSLRKSRVLSSPESIKKREFKSSTPIIASLLNSNHQTSLINNNDFEREIKSPLPLKSNLKEKKKIKKDEKIISNDKNHNNFFELSSSNEELSDSNYQVKSAILNKKKICYENYSESDSNSDRLSLDLKNKKNKCDKIDLISSKNKLDLELNETDSDNSFESVLIQPILEKFEEELIKSSKTEIIKDLSNYNKFSIKKYFKEINNFRSKKEKSEKLEERSIGLLSIADNSNISKLSTDDLLKTTRKEIPWENLELSSVQLLIKYVEKQDNSQSLPILYTKNGHKIKSSQIKKWIKILFDVKSIEKSHLETNNDNHKSSLNSESQKSIKLFKKDFLINKKRQIFDKVSKTTSKTINEISNSCSEISRKSSKLYSNIITDNQNKNKKKTKPIIPTENEDNYEGIKLEIPPHPTERTHKTKKQESLDNQVFDLTKSSNKILEFDYEDKIKNIKKEEIEIDSLSSKRKKAAKKEIDLDISKQTDYINDEFMNKSLINQSLIQESNNQKDKNDLVSSHKSTQENNKKKLSSSMITYDHFYNEIHENSFDVNQKSLAMKKEKANKKNFNLDNQISLNSTNSKDEKTKSMNRHIETNETIKTLNKLKCLNEKNNNFTSNSKQHTLNRKIDQIENERTDNIKNQSRISKSNSTTSLVPPLPEFTEFVCKQTNETYKTALKQSTCSLAKLKSPERKILYNEWFTIIKKMEKDPKFDLETLVRTRGRFTEHERISYRDRLMIKQQKLRCARSEPNFGTMLFMSQNINDDGAKNKEYTIRRNNISPIDEKDKRKNINSGKNRLKRNLSATLHDTSCIDNNKDIVLNGDFLAFDSKIRNNTKNLDSITKALNDNNTLSSALKLTLQKSDINLIKEILKKKEKSVISDLTNLAFGAKTSTLAKNNQIGNNILDTSNKKLNKDEKNKTLEKIEDKRGIPKNEKCKAIIKNSSKQSNNSDDRLSFDSILSNETELNKNKISKADSAKALCDEFTKIVKGTLGNTLKNLGNNGPQKDVNHKVNITQEKSQHMNKPNADRKDANHRNIQNEKKSLHNEKILKKSCSTLSSISFNSNESIIDNNNDEFIIKNSDVNLRCKDAKKNNKNTISTDDDVKLRRNCKNKIKKNEYIDNQSKKINQFDCDHLFEKKKQENFRKNQSELSNKKETPPPRPAPPRRPPPPRPLSPDKNINKSSHGSNSKQNINKIEKRTDETRLKSKQSNLPPRPPLPQSKSKSRSNNEELKQSEFNDSVFYNRGNKKSYDKNKINISTSSTSSRSNSSSPSELSLVNLKQTNDKKNRKKI